MPTLKKRINLSLDDSLYYEIEKLQKLTKAPSMSAVVIELAKEALELQEDLLFCRIADERESEETISHAKIWQKK